MPESKSSFLQQDCPRGISKAWAGPSEYSHAAAQGRGRTPSSPQRSAGEPPVGAPRCRHRGVASGVDGTRRPRPGHRRQRGGDGLRSHRPKGTPSGPRHPRQAGQAPEHSPAASSLPLRTPSLPRTAMDNCTAPADRAGRAAPTPAGTTDQHQRQEPSRRSPASARAASWTTHHVTGQFPTGSSRSPQSRSRDHKQAGPALSRRSDGRVRRAFRPAPKPFGKSGKPASQCDRRAPVQTGRGEIPRSQASS